MFATVPSGAAVLEDSCVPKGLSLPVQTDSAKTSIRSGRFAECSAAVTPLTNKNMAREMPCLFNGVHAPPLDIFNHRY